ncbi:unnamed protein product [Pylaiella littoralis]
MEDLRTSIEHEAASLRSYLSSLQVRGDTQFSLLLGALAGLVVVVILSVYPGKPIDYTGLGIDLPPGLRGEENAEDAEKRKSKKHDREEPPPEKIADQKKSDGLQQIQGVVENLSEMRRRKRAKQTMTPSPAPAPAARDGSLVRNTATSGEREIEVEWDASRLDEDKLARKIGSSKAARMLGLTEDQVRRAVVDAKEELQQSQSRSGGVAPRHNNDDDVGVSGFLSLAMLVTSLGAVWMYISTYPYGTLSRFLIGVFPREMEALGLAS